MKIGRLKKVDLRGIWAGEATDFTPWLAKEDNIALLSETVGIELEAYQIGDSIPAPLFQMVSKPNDWTKSVQSEKKHTELTPTKELNLEYWTEMRRYFEDSGTRLKTQKPSAQHWTNFAIGRSDFHMAAVSSVRDNFIRLEFLLNGNHSKERFDILSEKYEAESKEKIDQNLNWDRLDDKIVCGAFLKKNFDVSNKQDWPNQFAWIQEKLEKMDVFFRTKIKQIK